MDDLSSDSTQGAAPSPAAPVPNYAGFWIRLVAYAIDGFVLTIASAAVALSFSGVLKDIPEGAALDEMGIAIIIPAINMLIPFLYFVLLECSSKQATLGKMALGLRVTDISGRRISFARSLGRGFGKILSVLVSIGFLMIGFTAKKQGLHDMIAGTLVVKGR